MVVELALDSMQLSHVRYQLWISFYASSIENSIRVLNGASEKPKMKKMTNVIRLERGGGRGEARLPAARWKHRSGRPTFA